MKCFTALFCQRKKFGTVFFFWNGYHAKAFLYNNGWPDDYRHIRIYTGKNLFECSVCVINLFIILFLSAFYLILSFFTENVFEMFCISIAYLPNPKEPIVLLCRKVVLFLWGGGGGGGEGHFENPDKRGVYFFKKFLYYV